MGISDSAGKVYEIDWDEVFGDPNYYQDLIKSIDSKSFPLRKEYDDIRTLYNELVDEISHDDDEDLFDILD